MKAEKTIDNITVMSYFDGWPVPTNVQVKLNAAVTQQIELRGIEQVEDLIYALQFVLKKKREHDEKVKR